jgi:DNA-binding NarL/FixJ family response regulator
MRLRTQSSPKTIPSSCYRSSQKPLGSPRRFARECAPSYHVTSLRNNALRAAIEAAAAGLVVIHPSELDTVLSATVGPSAPLDELLEPLTRREREVLQMLAAGLANKEIAARLAISDHTVKFHVASILGKLGASTRTEAVSAGIRRGLVML